ncbi:hypothetical protein M433DRAFT_279018 [Acidomyces richmondensis BFW]|nr:MAG: hypothetical protein FE78DRAFT_434785 [Acidomyces sp. 'richmondensis']KYG44931.1 hypothetical protein M433DRAFT_279018 [Acidomyces richmondensis BFW]
MSRQSPRHVLASSRIRWVGAQTGSAGACALSKSSFRNTPTRSKGQESGRPGDGLERSRWQLLTRRRQSGMSRLSHLRCSSHTHHRAAAVPGDSDEQPPALTLAS